MHGYLDSFSLTVWWEECFQAWGSWGGNQHGCSSSI